MKSSKMIFLFLGICILHCVASAQSSLPPDFGIRLANENDLSLIQLMCPQAIWQYGTTYSLTCNTTNWSPWVNSGQANAIPSQYKAKFHALQLAQRGARCIVVYPDGSSHVEITANDFKYGGGNEVTWLIDPKKKQVDMIWESPSAPTYYLGPNSDVLESHSLEQTMLDIDDSAEPSSAAPDSTTHTYTKRGVDITSKVPQPLRDCLNNLQEDSYEWDPMRIHPSFRILDLKGDGQKEYAVLIKKGDEKGFAICWPEGRERILTNAYNDGLADFTTWSVKLANTMSVHGKTIPHDSISVSDNSDHSSLYYWDGTQIVRDRPWNH